MNKQWCTICEYKHDKVQRRLVGSLPSAALLNDNVQFKIQI